MAKLIKSTDRIHAVVECGDCGRNIPVSGDTFAEIQEKLKANTIRGADDADVAAPVMVDDGKATCDNCHKGDTSGEEKDREDFVAEEGEL